MKNKIKFSLFALSVTFSMSQAYAVDEKCYSLNRTEKLASKTPTLLCVGSLDSKNKKHEITLEIDNLGKRTTVATFIYERTLTAKCGPDCNPDLNKDEFGISNPSNSPINDLKIRFDGTLDPEKKTESGKIFIGSAAFFYRSID